MKVPGLAERNYGDPIPTLGELARRAGFPGEIVLLFNCDKLKDAFYVAAQKDAFALLTALNEKIPLDELAFDPDRLKIVYVNGNGATRELFRAYRDPEDPEHPVWASPTLDCVYQKGRAKEVTT